VPDGKLTMSVLPECQSTLNVRWCRNFGNITFQFIVQSRQNSWSSLLSAALALFCESDASRQNFFAGGGATGSGSANVDVASVAGVNVLVNEMGFFYVVIVI